MAQPPDERLTGGGITIRVATEKDHDAIWEIFQATITTGDTFVYDTNTPREKALAYWCAGDAATFVAEQDGKVIGSYILRPNQPGRGDHVANAGYMVAQSARGLGAGRAMGEHSLDEARRRGYRAMQFNFVVSTNESAVRLWQQFGFNIVGTLPGAFRHAQKGFVDVYVMFRSLGD
jgi:L-amino acid N-acyltransferase YncA